MLERIRLIDFQRFTDKVIVLDPRVTVFVGPTDAGKSAVLRSLRWLALNKPPAGNFIRHGCKLAKVTLWLDDHRITRSQGTGINEYWLDDDRKTPGGRGVVPEAISKLINVGEDHFQEQLDSPFWFMETPGEVSRQLNKVVNLEVIDAALSEADSRLKKARMAVQMSRTRLKEAKAEMQDLSWVPSLCTQMATVNSIQDRMAMVKTSKEALKALASELGHLVSARNETLAKCEKYERLIKSLDKLMAIRERIKRIRSLVSDLSHKPKLVDLNSIRETHDQLGMVKASKRRLGDLVTIIEHMESAKCQSEKDYQSAKRDLIEITKGRCPICLRPMPVES